MIGTGWSLEPALAADLDGDGLDELLVLLADGDAGVAANQGGGQFDTMVRYPIPVSGLYGTTLDASGDGVADLVVCADAGLSFLVSDGAGALDTSLFLGQSLGNACRPHAVDLDGDGREELLVAAPAALGWYLLRTCVP